VRAPARADPRALSILSVRFPRTPLTGVVSQDAEDRSVAVQVHQALLPAVRLELFPKSTIDVFISILETDGIESCTAAAAVAASAALADAGIEMLGLVMACTAVREAHFDAFDPSGS
jgi:exosome complex component MTR3